MTKEVINRNVKTDVIRGLALLLMFFAHSAPYIEDNSLTSLTIFRIICSLSAPIFLFLVGFNLKKGCNLNNLKKGLFILLSAVLIDLFIWNILPFYSFDVLYLIGFSIILFPLWLRLNKYLLFGLIVFLFTTTFIYQVNNLYEFSLNEISLSQLKQFSTVALLKNLFFDGWFPLFPWFSIVIFGYLVKNNIVQITKIIYIGISSFLLGLFLIFYNKPTYLRDFAIEIFYPFSFSYLLIAFGWIIILFNIPLNYNSKLLSPLSKLGKVSLFIYVFHLTLYHIFFSKLQNQTTNFYISNLVFIVLFFSVAYILESIKNKYKINNILFNYIFGK
ncbi:MAG: DUF1624 domain-containing protein [Flavobacteriales bacterium]|nr:DUF1624 domain-containing protein [Flavobacteriales bacterium]